MNTVQYITTMHSIEEMKKVELKSVERRHGIPKSSYQRDENGDLKLPFPMVVTEYNTHMGGSDGNAQQRSYYSSQRMERRYWWPLFIILLDAAVLNAYKLWGLLYPDSNMTHLEFQRQIIEGLISPKGQTRHRLPGSFIQTTEKAEGEEGGKTLPCEWEHLAKKAYCTPCKVQKPELRKRKAFEEIGVNHSKRQRSSQTRWRCHRCGPCFKKIECWEAVHS